MFSAQGSSIPWPSLSFLSLVSCVHFFLLLLHSWSSFCLSILELFTYIPVPQDFSVDLKDTFGLNVFGHTHLFSWCHASPTWSNVAILLLVLPETWCSLEQRLNPLSSLGCPLVGAWVIAGAPHCTHNNWFYYPGHHSLFPGLVLDMCGSFLGLCTWVSSRLASLLRDGLSERRAFWCSSWRSRYGWRSSNSEDDF